MWVTWIFAAFALAMVVGPVMMLRPSSGTSKLASIRAYANARGIAIRLPSPKKGRERHNGPRAAYYTLPLGDKARKLGTIAPWGIEKKQHEHEIHFQGLWDWANKDRPHDMLQRKLRESLSTMPEGIIAVQFNALGVSVLWDEMCRGKVVEAAVDEIIDFLRHLSNIVTSCPFFAEFSD